MKKKLCISAGFVRKFALLLPACMCFSLLFAQQTVTGIVSDETGPVAGASVLVKGSNVGVSTSSEGIYSINVTDDKAVLQFVLLGYATQEVTVGNQTQINVVLEAEAEQIGQVVVTALGMKRSERALGYVTQKVGGDKFEKVKGVNIATSLTGQIAGVNVKNSTEFMEDPKVLLRGEEALMVIDGVPYKNMGLKDLNQDDIESINVLKGASAAALYGQRGANGAIMVTTKKGGKKGFTLDINSSNMFYAGEMAMPKNQTSYSSGTNGVYDHYDWIWGDKLDAGKIYEQWDPVAKEYRWMELTSKGKNNLEDFLEFSMISNTTLSVSQQGENGGIRSSLSYLYNKAQYPNQKLQRFGYTLSGNMKLGSKVTVDGSMGFTKRISPNSAGAGSWENGYVYNILMWTGPDYRLKDFRDYWLIPHEKQNWHYDNWYDNPWMSAYECLDSKDENKLNGMFAVSYKPVEWINVLVRSGLDYYGNKNTLRNPLDVRAWRKWMKQIGMYAEDYQQGWSWNNDLIVNMDKKFGKFSVNALAGGTVFYYQTGKLKSTTKNGLNVPGYYSLLNSKESPSVETDFKRKQVNSLFGSVSLGYANAVFVDVTGRNDWSSTLPEEEQSYFYPSVGGSLILTEIFSLPEWTKMWKVRGSWTVSKTDLDIYAINRTYGITLNAWDGLNSADYPEKLRGKVNPVTNRTYELGTAFYFLENNRLKLDVAYFNRLQYDLTAEVDISPSSGYKKMLINTGEETVRRGVEVTVEAVPVIAGDFRWNVTANWSTARKYYAKLDETFTPDKPWISKGARTDFYEGVDYQRDPQGNIVHNAGLPIVISGSQVLTGYKDPDWIWGLSNSFKYKNWTLTVNFDGRAGGKMFNELDRYSWTNGSNPDSDNQWRYDEVVNGKKNYIGQGVNLVSGSVKYDAYGRILEDNRVFEPNTKEVGYQAYTKALNGTNWLLPYFQDATFLKLRELSLNYDIPVNFAKKLGMTKASVAVVGQNLLLWVKEFRFSDPDKGFDGNNDMPAPSVRYLGFNINLSF